MKTTYRIDFTGSRESRTASSYAAALAIARRTLAVGRLYRGAEYYTRFGEPETGYEATDLWISSASAARENGAPADAVVARPSTW